MFIVHFVTSTVLGLVATSSAHAVQANVTQAAPGRVVATTEPTAAIPAARPRRYCISDRREGAPRRPKICRTRDEWQARGFDPLIAIGQL
ncbi:hypothetical protein ASE65_15950 [Sphingomonas sp. Leaf16]|nr:hypothetical protein ASE65_15950 [Sphingomonas sp. Leaf16]KQN16881.1 hypothetical protein ASE81_16000 [Sphingomonas sp. Leaf29]KQN22862.1 hypothetical protein ASE83_15925 [Sphingomonas sp. Leaf32]